MRSLNLENLVPRFAILRFTGASFHPDIQKRSTNQRIIILIDTT
jgi:hypothetical protein